MEETSSLLVQVEGLNVYQENKQILENVNLHVGVGEFVYLIGKVGSGKSSLLKTLYCELPINEGNACVAGYDLKKIKNSKIHLLRRKIGMVFQDFELMNDRTVYENLRFVLKATGWSNKQDIDTRINEVLQNVGMLEKKMSMPAQLSGGERQSVSVARALLNNPPVIFADEPTGNLDPESADKIVSLLYNLCKSGKSVLMVTHNHGFFRKYAGRIYTFANKTVSEIDDNKFTIAIDDFDEDLFFTAKQTTDTGTANDVNIAVDIDELTAEPVKDTHIETTLQEIEEQAEPEKVTIPEEQESFLPNGFINTNNDNE